MLITAEDQEEKEVEVKTSSPVPDKEEKKMKYRFDYAMREIADGARMKRKTWNKDEYIELRDEVLKLHSTDGKWYNWGVHETDLTAFDYIKVDKVV